MSELWQKQTTALMKKAPSIKGSASVFRSEIYAKATWDLQQNIASVTII